MAAKNSNKDKEMASYLKQHGITRTSARCPICHGVISLAHLYAHISFRCGGGVNEDVEDAAAQ